MSQTSTEICHKQSFIYSGVLYTTLCEVESFLNNRPLTNISDDVSDYECLAQNHFLIRELSPNFSPRIFTDKEINPRRK